MVFMLSIRPLIFSSSSFLSNPQGAVSSVLITIGIAVILIFHSSFSSQVRPKYFLFALFDYKYVVRWDRTFHNLFHFILFHFIVNDKLGLVFWLGLCNQFLSQNSKEFYASNFLERSLVYVYTICNIVKI